MSVPFEDLEVGQRYSFTHLVTKRVDTGVLKNKYVVENGKGGEKSLVISLDGEKTEGEGERLAPYSFYNIRSLEKEASQAMESVSAGLGINPSPGSGPVGNILDFAGLPRPKPGKGGKRKTRKSKKRSRKTRRR